MSSARLSPLRRGSPVRTEARDAPFQDDSSSCGDGSGGGGGVAAVELQDVAIFRSRKSAAASNDRRRSSTISLMSTEEHARSFVEDEHNDVPVHTCVKLSYRFRLVFDLWLLSSAAGQAAFAVAQLVKNSATNAVGYVSATPASSSGNGAVVFSQQFALSLLGMSVFLCGLQLSCGTAVEGLTAATRFASSRQKRLQSADTTRTVADDSRLSGGQKKCSRSQGCELAFHAWSLQARRPRLCAQIFGLLAVFVAYLLELNFLLKGEYPAGLDLQFLGLATAWQQSLSSRAVIACAWVLHMFGLCGSLFCALIWVEHDRGIQENVIALQEKYLSESYYSSGLPVSARLSRILDLSDADIADKAIQAEIIVQDLGGASTTTTPTSMSEDDELMQHTHPLVCETAPNSKSTLRRRRSMSESVEAIIQRRSAEVIKKTKHVCQVCQKKKAECVYLPCRHFLHCKNCASVAGQPCSKCEMVIEESLRIFQ